MAYESDRGSSIREHIHYKKKVCEICGEIIPGGGAIESLIRGSSEHIRVGL